MLSMPQAVAHADLIKSNPASGDVVTSMPNVVTLEFGENLLLLGDKEVNTFTITAPNGSDVSIGSMSVIQNTITADINEADFVNGDYTLSWKNVASDGHKDEGSFTFTLKDPNAPSPESSLLDAPAQATDSHGVTTGVLTATGVLVIVLVLLIAYRRFSQK